LDLVPVLKIPRYGFLFFGKNNTLIAISNLGFQGKKKTPIQGQILLTETETCGSNPPTGF
jgi:hypothetical protein